MFISKYKKRTPFFGKNAPPFRGLEIKEEKKFYLFRSNWVHGHSKSRTQIKNRPTLLYLYRTTVSSTLYSQKKGRSVLSSLLLCYLVVWLVDCSEYGVEQFHCLLFGCVRVNKYVHGGQFSSLWFSMVGLFSWTNGYWLMGDFFAGLSDWLVVRYGRVVLSVW